MPIARVLILATLAAITSSTDGLDAQEVQPRKAPVLRQIRPNEWAVRVDRRLLMLPNWLSVEEVAASDGDKGDAVEDEPGWQARVSDAGFDRSVFGAIGNWDAVRHELDVLLSQAIDDSTERYGLTAVQQAKLQLAGRGDIQRLFDQVEKSRLRFQLQVINDVAGLSRLEQDFATESADLRARIKRPFGNGSLFSKTLRNTLTTAQLVAYEKWKRNAPAVVTRHWDLWVRPPAPLPGR
jgi:hypothetical protein